MPSQSQLFLHKFRNSWKLILAVILIAPLIKWFFIEPIDARLSNISAITDSLGQITGITGTLLFSFSLILSFRNKITETIFGGLDKLYRVHHLSGMYGLFILLLHPLLLSIPKLTYSVEEAGRFFTPFSTSTAVDFGIFSLLSFIVLIGLTLFGVIFSYESLKKTHLFLGFAFLLGTIHGFLIPGDIQDDVFIRIWVLGFAFVGIVMYIAHSFFKKLFVHKYLYKVSSVKKIEGGITELSLVPTEDSFGHLPGQFGFFSFINSKVVTSESHPFTISSWKGNGEIAISVKALGDFTSLLSVENVGDLVKIEGPFGEFCYDYGAKKQVWVAGGVGVTPFVSFAEHILTQNELSYNIEFFYSIRTKDDIAYNALFEQVAQKFSSFVYRPMPSDTNGFITGQLLKEKVENIVEADIFICGPPPMMKVLIASLISLGIKRSAIHSELFSLLK